MLASLYRLYDRHLKPRKPENDRFYRQRKILHSVLSRIGAAKLKRSLTARPIELDGHRLIVDPRDSLGLFGGKRFDPDEIDAVRRALKPGDVAVDVGANIGVYTLEMARAVGTQGRVWAFEPDPANAVLLEKNVMRNGYRNVTVIRAAVADFSGRSTIARHADNAGMHKLSETGDVDVEVVRLDDLVQPPVKFLKIDVEGAEAAVLRGAHRTIAQSPHLSALVEYNPSGLRAFGSNLEELVDSLSGLSFSIVGQNDGSPLERLAAMPDGAYANLLFQKSS